MYFKSLNKCVEFKKKYKFSGQSALETQNKCIYVYFFKIDKKLMPKLCYTIAKLSDLKMIKNWSLEQKSRILPNSGNWKNLIAI